VPFVALPLGRRLRDVSSGITGEYKDDGRRYYTTSDLMDAEWAAIEPPFSGYDSLTSNVREMVNDLLVPADDWVPWRGSRSRQPTATSGRRSPMAAAKRAGFMAAST
jgi:hypothetical protein